METIVAAVVVAAAAEIAGNTRLLTYRALERGIWQQVPRFFLLLG